MVAGAYLAIFGLSLANAYFGWRFFGDYGWEVVVATTLLGVIITTYFMPSARRH
jgi:hypothetical protein